MHALQSAVLFVFSLLSIGSLSQSDRSTEQLVGKIDKYLSAGSTNGFSGAISVVYEGKLIINKGYGLANKDTQTLNGPNTVFDIGSNTKQFTAAAILKLYELGKLKLDDKLSLYFDGLPTDKQNISIHQLLTHTAGFMESIGNDFDKVSTEDFFQQLFTRELAHQPGTIYSYSNVGYSVLGRIIELASGQTYEAFLKEHLFTPAGMQQTGYLLPDWDTKTLARGYNRNVLETDPTATRYQEDGEITWHLKANGGINSTQNDMLLWYKALKNNTVLNAKSFELLSTPHAPWPEDNYSYGYGWVVSSSKEGAKRLSHGGSNGTYKHSLIWYPEEDIFIVYATNANSAKVEYLASEVDRMIFDENYVPEPIIDNVYSFTINYLRNNPISSSENLATLLEERYSEEFESKGLLNTVGNLLLRWEENLQWAVELFKLNVARFPDDGNLWDSLGDGYRAINNKEQAIKAYKEAVRLGYEGAAEKLAALSNG